MSHKMALDKVNTQWISVGFPLIEALGKKLRFQVRRISKLGGTVFEEIVLKFLNPLQGQILRESLLRP